MIRKSRAPNRIQKNTPSAATASASEVFGGGVTSTPDRGRDGTAAIRSPMTSAAKTIGTQATPQAAGPTGSTQAATAHVPRNRTRKNHQKLPHGPGRPKG